MPELLHMPEVAAGTESAVLSEWSLGESEQYVVGDVIAMIETAKAAVDIEAEADGVLVKRLVEAGTDVAVGAPIALVAAPGETVGDVDQALAALGVQVAKPADTSAPAAIAGGDASSAPQPINQAAAVEQRQPALAGASADRDGRVFSSPIARKMARVAGVDLMLLVGSGPGGRILRSDVEAAIARGPATAGKEVIAAAPVTAAQQSRQVSGANAAAVGTSIPHTAMRRLIAARLTESKRTVPHFYLRGMARMGRLLALRAELNDDPDTKISINDLIVKAVASASRRVPAVNVQWSEDAIIQFDNVDVAIAIATPTGLVTPVLRAVDQMSITEVAVRTRDMAARARSGNLKQSEIEGGSTTVSNLGMYGTPEFDAIINPPQASILAVGAVRAEPVVDGDEIVVSKVAHFTMSADHRSIDGALAAEWMQALVSLLEQPLRILA